MLWDGGLFVVRDMPVRWEIISCMFGRGVEAKGRERG